MTGFDPGWLLAGAFAVWLALCVISQIRTGWVSSRRHLDVPGLAPAWNLFAPRPIVTDYIILYRLWEGGEESSWLRVNLPGRRRWSDFVFNPSRRQRKAMWTAAHAISWRPEDHRVSPLDPAYLLVLGVVTSAARDQGVRRGQIQYRVDCIKGGLSETPERLRWFLSEVHTVGTEDE